MKRSRSVMWACCLMGLLLAGVSAFGDQPARSFVRITPEQAHWVEQPGGLGVKIAVLEGDPAKPGYYATLVNFPPGVMSRPHYHPEERYCVVIRGTWYTATNDEFTPEKAIPLKPGSYMRHPAGGHHYDGAREEEVIVEISGYGPSKNTLINPREGLFGRSMPKK